MQQASGEIVVLDRRRRHVKLDDLAYFVLGRCQYLVDFVPLGFMTSHEPSDSRRVIYDVRGEGRLVHRTYAAAMAPSSPPASLARPMEWAGYEDAASSSAAPVVAPSRPPLVTITSRVDVNASQISLDLQPALVEDSAIDLSVDVPAKPRPLVDYASSSFVPPPTHRAMGSESSQRRPLAPSPRLPDVTSTSRRPAAASSRGRARSYSVDENVPPSVAQPSSPCVGTALVRHKPTAVAQTAVRSKSGAPLETSRSPPCVTTRLDALTLCSSDDHFYAADDRMLASATPIRQGPQLNSYDTERIDHSITPPQRGRPPKHLRRTPLLSLRKPKTPLFVAPDAPRRARRRT